MFRHNLLIASAVLLTAGIMVLPLEASGAKESPTGTALTTEFVEDAMGHKVPVPASTDRIICINSGLSVLLAALGEGEDIVGRDGNSTFPSSLRPVYVVAANSSRPNIELILEKRPDLILADNMLPHAAYDKFTSLGIPTAVLKTSDPREFEKTILTVGTLTGRYLEARRIVDFMNSEIQRISTLAAEAAEAQGRKTKVFFENRKPYSSASSLSGSHIPLEQAGCPQYCRRRTRQLSQTLGRVCDGAEPRCHRQTAQRGRELFCNGRPGRSNFRKDRTQRGGCCQKTGGFTSSSPT